MTDAPNRSLPAPDGSPACLVVVTRNPDGGLRRRLEVLADAVGGLVVVDNGSASTASLDELPAPSGCRRVVRNGGNPGLGVALNQGWREAARAGFREVLFLDQDTEPDASMPRVLTGVRAEAPGPVAVVGSNYRDVHKGKTAAACGAGARFVERKTVITAGSLVSVSVLEALGGFREDYFIDSIDHEFCLRARSEGFRVLLACPVLMTQRIGRPARHLGLLRGLGAYDHPPERKYYIARNVVLTMRAYALGEPLWCLRQFFRLAAEAVSMLLFESERGAKAAAFLRGLGHGIRGRSGPWPRRV